MSRRRILTASAIALLVATAISARRIGWSLVDATIRHDCPRVRRITTAELALWLNDPARTAPRLLDVRTRAEYDVSHLPGAEHVSPDATADSLNADHAQPIVTYCSVGYRSGLFAERLIDAGFTSVANLEGSIFRWANEGRPLLDARGAPSRKVHPYNSIWGMLLDRKHRADVAPVP